MSVVGIDAGSSFSVVTVATRRVIQIAVNGAGRRKTASAVSFDGKQRVLGDDAQSRVKTNFKNTILSVRRLLGLEYESKERELEQQFQFCKLCKMPNGRVGVEVMYDGQKREMSAEAVMAALLRCLAEVGETGLDGGVRVQDCVLSVPPYWNDAQRHAMLDAARIAGLNPLRLMNETTAVALQYGIVKPLEEGKHTNVLFVDVGDGSTNAAVVSFTQGKLQVRSTASDPNCGGRDFTKVLVDHFVEDIKKRFKMDPTTNVKAMLKLHMECERVKKVLSANAQAPLNIEYLMNDTDVRGQVERTEFEELCAGLLLRVVEPAKRALLDAGLTAADLFAVEVVGGGMRVPCVQTALQEALGVPKLSFTCDADEAVGRGCALQCAMLSPSFKVRDFDVADVSPYPIQISWGDVPADGVFKPEDSVDLFTARNAIPSTKMISFKDRKAPLQIVASYSSPDAIPVTSNPWIGTFTVKDLPKKPDNATDKAPKMKVKVKLDINGVVTIGSVNWIQEITVKVPEAKKPDVTIEEAPAAAADGDKKEEKKDDDETAEASPAASGGGDAAAAAAAAEKMETEEEEQSPPAAEAGAGAGAESTEKADGAAKESEKMEAEAEVEAEAEAPRMVDKVKTSRTTLRVDSSKHGGMSREAIETVIAEEAAMAAADRLIAETNEARNELESYVLEVRTQVEDQLREYIRDKDREAYVKELNEMEDWLYDEGYDEEKASFTKRLATLQRTGEAVKKRKFEEEHRPGKTSALKSSIVKYQLAADSSDEKYAHITDEERAEVRKLCEEMDRWLVDNMAQQMQRSKADDPVFFVGDVEAKHRALEKQAGKIMNKPKPAPPAKEDEKKKEEEGGACGDEKAKKEQGGDAMETEEADGDASAAAAAAGGDDAQPDDAPAPTEEEEDAAPMEVEEK